LNLPVVRISGLIIQIGGQRNPVLRVQATSRDQHALAFAKIDFAEIEARKPRMLVAFGERDEVVANYDHLRRLKRSPTMPLAFTEHGALMTVFVLNTPRVVEVKQCITRRLSRDNPRDEMGDIGQHKAIGQRLAATGPNLQDR